MNYISTRGASPAIDFESVVLQGLAGDGGLYVPDVWPRLSADEIRALGRLTYPELAARILALFAGPSLGEAELALIAESAYRDFAGYPNPAPLVPLGEGIHLLELFHGPTLAFKDYALQVLGWLFDLILARRGERITILGATSGDTGSAAIEACRGREAVEIFILHPKGRVSEVQRRQMTTVDAANVHNIAIEGTFDDCQDLVKALFNDSVFRQTYSLAAINSINWARIAAQVVYYVHAALLLGAPDRPVSFAVPTGNFGNVFAGWVALQLGIPIRRLIVGSNRNDILARFFATGRMQTESVVPTLSPSMDIQISSNFERYLFELFARDSSAVSECMASLRKEGSFAVSDHQLDRVTALFCGVRCDDEETVRTIRSVHNQSGMLIDPHSAVGVAAARQAREKLRMEEPVVTLATAHPAKFPDAVAHATGVLPELPARLEGLLSRPERYDVLPADAVALQQKIASTVAKE